METDRIAIFKNMTEADPGNELAFFSLGRAYFEAGQIAEAVPALQRVIALNASFSKAYALLASAQRVAGDEKGAIETLTQGYRIAHDRGDLMLRNDMAMQLKEMGAPVPEIETEELTQEAIDAGKIKCSRCGRVALKMLAPPFRDELGNQIHNTVCPACFQEWLPQGTKVINELRLNLTEKHAQDIYDQHMKEFLNISST